MALGFTAGGWTSSGGASDRAEREVASKLLASVCGQSLASSANAAKDLTEENALVATC